MARFRLSRRAEADLLSIVDYTLRNWGEAQATRYIGDLEAGCQMIADKPALGRACDDVSPGLSRMECGRHVVFYQVDAGDILVWRILHQSMLPEGHASDEGAD